VSPSAPVAGVSLEAKTCARCGKALPVACFSSAKDGRQAWCKACFKAYRAARREIGAEQLRALRTKAAEHVLAVLTTRTCADCAVADVVVLEFDHVRGVKRNAVATLVHGAASRRTLDDEIAKCDVVCVNCHRERTRSRSPSRSTLPLPHEVRGRAAVAAGMLDGCVDCGNADPAVLDFDHRGPKRLRVSQMPRYGYSVEAIEAEMAVCDVRCGNCHRRRTARAGAYFRARALAPDPLRIS